MTCENSTVSINGQASLISPGGCLAPFLLLAGPVLCVSTALLCCAVSLSLGVSRSAAPESCSRFFGSCFICDSICWFYGLATCTPGLNELQLPWVLFASYMAGTISSELISKKMTVVKQNFNAHVR